MNYKYVQLLRLEITEDRSHYNALGHCAGKLVRVIYKMLSCNIEFDLD